MALMVVLTCVLCSLATVAALWRAPLSVGLTQGRTNYFTTADLKSQFASWFAPLTKSRYVGCVMKSPSYHIPAGGHPPQTQLLTSRAVFTESYAVIPKGVMQDITTSYLPHWQNTRAWIIARPLSGFAETFSHYIMDVAAKGGSSSPDNDPEAQSVIFVVDGNATLLVGKKEHPLKAGSYAYIPAFSEWSLHNGSNGNVRFHWIRKAYEPVIGVNQPDAFVTHEQQLEPTVMPGTDGAWSTTRFVDPSDLRHDMHVNIVNFEPGGTIPFAETHVMEHGLYVLEGKAVYRLNNDWVEVEAGDYMWLRAFCPQACYAGGPGRFRYLLYKDVNRHAKLRYK
jgi:(S)-ureidoglycine aminohydrolase